MSVRRKKGRGLYRWVTVEDLRSECANAHGRLNQQLLAAAKLLAFNFYLSELMALIQLLTAAGCTYHLAL